MIRIAIVDDDAEDRRTLEAMVRRVFTGRPEEYSVHTFPDGEDLLAHYDSTYSIIFLDVEMQWSHGIDVARSIRERDRDTVLIFVSRIAQYALQGYSVDAMDYILKPLEYFSFEKRVLKALNHIATHRSHKIRIPTDSGYRWIMSDDLLYAEVYGHSLVYHTVEGEFRASGTIGSLAETLRPYHFIQITRFTLVNLLHVTGLEGCDLLIGDTRLPISRRRRKEIIDALLAYNGGSL